MLLTNREFVAVGSDVQMSLKDFQSTEMPSIDSFLTVYQSNFIIVKVTVDAGLLPTKFFALMKGGVT